MKNQWLEFYKGIITVRTSGKGIERFINTLTRDGISIWNVKSHGTHIVTFQMKLDDVKRLRIYARKSDCKIEFIKRRGFPFLQQRILRNGGFLVGALAFLIIIFMLSNMVWNVEIKGANPATEYKMMKELKGIGVSKGKLQFFIDKPEGIQRHLTNNIKELTWVGVELKGTTYYLQVVEKNEPKKTELFSPRNLIAKKKGMIVDMFVEEGTPKVKINDFVKPGQILVSGAMGNEEEEKAGTNTVPARGEVFAETWYKSKVQFPLKKTSQVYTGNEQIKHYINFGSLPLPVWGFGKVKYEEFETEENVKNFKFLKWEIPISYTSKTFRESEQMTKIYDHKEGIEEARKFARNAIKNDLDENATIKGENVLHQAVENGKVTLSIHFQIIENIAEGQPIIQGDSE
ncbi:sporulation protein YqfD [Cytobacillus purgationiresistens]|uniref:Sporulation protein YqfD n=1 Tax=Cytobacillus purgationiresistens TaxID=863449 RepID=A0ABU0AFK3_9BACI|nr:sporulation protein YqfD [Cytobacillus purgationiresistens]MDQ0269496.1 hypothetical protein [Cytobacillus purgationiresistens]